MQELETIYKVFGHALILVNILGYLMVIFPGYRTKKLKFIKESGYHLWQEQLVSILEIALGILLISI